MKIEDILSSIEDEHILWDYVKTEKSRAAASVASLWFLLAAADVFINAIFLFAMFATEGIWGTMLSPYGFLLPFLLFPLWKWLHDFHKAAHTDSLIRYAVTEKGIYIQTGDKDFEETEHIALDKIVSASVLRTMDNSGKFVGNVTCRIRTEFGDASERTVFEDVPDYREAAALINEYAKKRTTELENRKLLNGGVSEAEQYRKPTKLTAWRKKDEKNPGDPLLELHTLLAVAKAKKEQAEQEMQEKQKLEAEIYSMPYPAPEKPKKQTDYLKEDPEKAFFGNMRKLMPRPGETRTFLDPQAAAETEWLMHAEDETVSELQQELFGGEAMRTQVFPDPTVNPLPELSKELPEEKDDNGQFMQRGL